MNFYVNISETDNTLESAPENFIEVASDDEFIFSEGSDVVKDGEPIPSSDELNDAFSVIPDTGEEKISKVFLADTSENLLREIKLAGIDEKRYVFAVKFTELSQWEPAFEIWDNEDYNSYDLNMLGSGTPNDSLIKGSVTTLSNPDFDIPLAGGADTNRLLLNSGAGKIITNPTYTYFNLKAFVKSEMVSGFEKPIFLIRFYELIT
jgi:hypothetical protein